VAKGAAEAFEELCLWGMNQNLCSSRWVTNHYTFVVWKLASMVLRLENCDHLWSWDVVMDELKVRYEVEVNQARRSCLKAIIEKDDIPSRHMILLIVKLDANGVILSDGWYSISAKLDEPLSHFAKIGKLFVGMKLHVQGSQVKFFNKRFQELVTQYQPLTFRLHLT
jgi:breast cancer 2 susceptibility protein